MPLMTTDDFRRLHAEKGCARCRWADKLAVRLGTPCCTALRPGLPDAACTVARGPEDAAATA